MIKKKIYQTKAELIEGLEYRIAQLEKEIDTTESGQVIKQLSCALSASQQLLKDVQEAADDTPPFDFDDALSGYLEPLLEEAGFGRPPDVAPVGPTPDLTAGGAQIHQLEIGSRGVPGN